MFFLQAAQIPVQVCIGRQVYLVPKMEMDELTNWGMDIAQESFDKATEGMEDNRRREFQSMYPMTAPGLQQMAQHVRTTDGIKRVIRHCFSRCQEGYIRLPEGKKGEKTKGPTEQEVESWIFANGPGRLASLAWELADLNDVSHTDPDPDPPDTDKTDPLP